MSYFIGAKIGIDGEQAFRQSIKNIGENLKTLNSEMKTVTSQYDKNDKSSENLAAQNEVLNKQIEEQRKMLAELGKGLTAATEKYGDSDKITQSWQRSVNEATAKLNTMERQLKTNMSGHDERRRQPFYLSNAVWQQR
jgi:chromosome segregation ATPase